MTDDLRDFNEFLLQREKAAGSYVRGEAGPLDKMVTRESPATFFPPSGGYTQGAKEVAERYQKDAGAFAEGSENHVEVLHVHASGGLGYWVGLQHASVNLRGKDEPVPFHLRVTELYRREGGSWKMIHRHADSHVEVTLSK